MNLIGRRETRVFVDHIQATPEPDHEDKERGLDRSQRILVQGEG